MTLQSAKILDALAPETDYLMVTPSITPGLVLLDACASAAVVVYLNQQGARELIMALLDFAYSETDDELDTPAG